MTAHEPRSGESAAEDGERSGGEPASRGLVIVANRLPVRRVSRGGRATWSTSPGGLVSALVPVLQRTRGTWIGWAGSHAGVTAPFEHDGITNVPVRLSRSELRGYYEGFANATLWPLYHDCIRPPVFRREWWDPYVSVNRRFAEAADASAPRDGNVWVHDYHLQLVPALLRERRPDLRIGFFLHIPFPPQELFQQLPWRRQVIEGLLGADVVGFQTRIGAENFARLARAYKQTGGKGGAIAYEGREVVAQAYPISIDHRRFSDAARDPETRRRAQRVRDRVGGRRILLGVDRLDYTKGIDVRLEAWRELLRAREVRPEEHVLIQTAVPSRENVRAYRNLRRQVELLVGEINGDHGSIGRPVVQYLHRNLPFEELVSLYVAAEIMVVTPLRDGMNLVAKEFVSSRVDGRGVLVLSEFTGAAHELKQALIVNPHDVEGLAASLHAALGMPEQERTQRMRAMRAVVRRHDVHAWARSFLGDLCRGREGIVELLPAAPPNPAVSAPQRSAGTAAPRRER